MPPALKHFWKCRGPGCKERLAGAEKPDAVPATWFSVWHNKDTYSSEEVAVFHSMPCLTAWANKQDS